MKLTQEELYTILKGLNMICNTGETKLSSLDIMQLQHRLENYYKETA